MSVHAMLQFLNISLVKTDVLLKESVASGVSLCKPNEKLELMQQNRFLHKAQSSIETQV